MKPLTPHKPAAGASAKPGLTRPMTSEERRRAQRVLLRIPVRLHIPGKPQPVEGFTHTVSANGALILVPEPIAQGTKFSLENPKTQKTVEANVVRPPQFNPEGLLVPVEFLGTAPNFWNVFFPPIVN